MKALILGLLILTTKTYASGCDDGNPMHFEEAPVMSLGTHYAYTGCHTDSCYIYTSKSEGEAVERHSLYATKTGFEVPMTEIKVEVKMYRQYYTNSCTELTRYVVGAEYEGKRYREAADLNSI
ncbi:hypothetical protein SHI21_11250 [Bacteriovorax sp. PP10]|uniref:Lipoprotein n=1 Tax=Bacteriovorax antarcticus TaxID=3088717 RepID=A0ABU5VV11_9BACT|nr:hypothetical protein [Bacteriovorax sp. PP10]MEA9356787.1 hypothetical protein [Bacteriovorax sp. PP10]